MAYLDHAATTPLRPEVVEAMAKAGMDTGNASSLHASGRRARRVVEESREAIAGVLRCRPGDVIFTSVGTEADNLAVKGLHGSRRAADDKRRRILASGVEHHAVMDPLVWLEESGQAEIVWLPVDPLGRVSADQVAAELAADPESVSLVTVMWANNEVGTTQPVPEIARAANEFGIPMHTDAVQAVGSLAVDFGASGVTSMAVSAHKLGGPVGVGALVLDRKVDVVAQLHGGGQERGVRSGTLNVAGIAGFATAMVTAAAEQEAEVARLAGLRAELVRRVAEAVPGAQYNGDPDPAGRLPGNAHFSFPGCEGDALLLLLDARGVECSTGSACSAGLAQPSHVLIAMGMDEAGARSSLRFTLGHTSSAADIDSLLAALPAAVERARVAPRLRRAAPA
jgi:cysteine desulfurase